MKRILIVAAALLVVGGAFVLFVVPRGRAQVEVTVEPAMTKGPAQSGVTIVEFSDYQ